MRFLLCVLAAVGLAACSQGEDFSAVAPGNIVAEKIAAVPGPGRCGISDAWLVREVAGVQLSRPTRLSHRAMIALDQWVSQGAIPAVGSQGGGLQSLTVVADYACRTRNHRPGARLSEHSFGNAIDISAVTLRDGTRLTVLNDWRSGNSEVMRRLWRSACGPFGTVLGPNADRFHQDHFHFDVAVYPRGSYCR